MSRTLVVVLGDQLSRGISSLAGLARDETIVLMAEVQGEATYVKHHKKKLVFVFSAMRHFANTLRTDGWHVDYVQLDDPANTGSLAGEVKRALNRHEIRQIRITEPGEWRVLDEIATWPAPVEITPDDRFLTSREQFANWARGRKTLRLEYFYRELRRRTGLLMNAGQPEGGQWNFDHDNRKRAPRDLLMPRPLRFPPDSITLAVIELVGSRFENHFGALEPFWFPVTAADAERAAEYFITTTLPKFGDYQDAMLDGEPFLYHSVLAPCLNVGLLDPLALCRRAETAYHAGDAPLNAVEGFIRQIIGWREYVRGIYWLAGPDYVTRNELGAGNALPAFYWTGETDMACLADAIRQTRDEAYAHHIQRLMITGNFAMLAGINPHAVHEWYLSVYADAFEWVEAPNTIGMSQFADGGLLASKPYAASGAYINRMSDYCRQCRYDVRKRLGEDACPFNALYWDFLARHRARLASNPRMSQMYRTWDSMTPADQDAVRSQAGGFIAKICDGSS